MSRRTIRGDWRPRRSPRWPSSASSRRLQRSASPSPSAAASQPAASAASAAPRRPRRTSRSTITVGVLRPGATQEAVDALNLQISEFEAKYPWITVKPEEYNWTAPTFTAALAAGTLPTSSRSRSPTARA